MVFKALQETSLRPVSLILQTASAFLLFGLVFLFGLNKGSFLIGFVFSYLYIGLFFYSIKLIFVQKRRALGILLLFSKWLLLLFALVLVAWLLDGKSFLLGLSQLLVFLLSYVLEYKKVI
ncbi:MAG: hypothetical protein OXJ52_03635 [Oligoflexia bacterium]|nr:hypothetical protein [Oligoflexia bacterium]